MRSTGSGGEVPLWIAAPISRSRSCDVSGNPLSRRRTRTEKVAGRRRSITRSAAAVIASGSRSQARQVEAAANPKTRSSRAPTSSAVSLVRNRDRRHGATVFDAGVDSGQGRFQVSPQSVEEEAPVPALERRLSDLCQHAHGQRLAVELGACRGCARTGAPHLRQSRHLCSNSVARCRPLCQKFRRPLD